jgi:hypothetical protein
MVSRARSFRPLTMSEVAGSLMGSGGLFHFVLWVIAWIQQSQTPKNAHRSAGFA